MKVAIFGGTFDPIHCGHLAAARAARKRFGLDAVYFIPTGCPPHRPEDRLTEFEHRYAMVALACAGEPAFIPSLAEAPSARKPNYSIDTVRRFRRNMKPRDRLFFLIGVDAFLEMHTWRQWRALLDSAEFIVVSRPGFPLDEVTGVFPPGTLRSRRSHGDLEEFRLARTTAWMLAGVSEPISATEIRRRARHRRNLAGLVPKPVAAYIAKQHLYEPGADASRR